jgi:Mg2+-importing ATPase
LLIITALIAFIITVYLPFSPFADVLGFSIAHSQQIMAIGFILVAYIITADILKIIFFRINDLS